MPTPPPVSSPSTSSARRNWSGRCSRASQLHRSRFVSFRMFAGQADMYDVAIVGCGPVGATFANLLAKYGLRIAVVEQAAGIYDKPRAITLDHEVLRVFQACGLADVMEKSIVPHPGTHYLGVDG